MKAFDIRDISYGGKAAILITPNRWDSDWSYLPKLWYGDEACSHCVYAYETSHWGREYIGCGSCNIRPFKVGVVTPFEDTGRILWPGRMRWERNILKQ